MHAKKADLLQKLRNWQHKNRQKLPKKAKLIPQKRNKVNFKAKLYRSAWSSFEPAVESVPEEDVKYGAMRIDVLTLFPQAFQSPLSCSILKRAQDNGLLEITVTDIRDFAKDNYRKVDDKPYGGGPGMVMMPGPVLDCFEFVQNLSSLSAHTILLSPGGHKFDQAMAEELSKKERLILIAGRYEGFDERIGQCLEARQISIGDYVMTGGELAAMVIIDAVARLLPGVLGDEDSAKDESFSRGLLEYPQYTKPVVFRGLKVPDILLSGDHARIAQWRNMKAIERTKQWRPDLLEGKNYDES